MIDNVVEETPLLPIKDIDSNLNLHLQTLKSASTNLLDFEIASPYELPEQNKAMTKKNYETYNSTKTASPTKVTPNQS